MKIAPAEDGGSLKNEGSERDVFIHLALLKRGFLEFVKSRGDGPLFYGRGRTKSRPSASPGRRHTSKGVANHLAKWIRENGFTDKRKAPNRAFRHWFKTACQRAACSTVWQTRSKATAGATGKQMATGTAVVRSCMRPFGG